MTDKPASIDTSSDSAVRTEFVPCAGLDRLPAEVRAAVLEDLVCLLLDGRHDSEFSEKFGHKYGLLVRAVHDEVLPRRNARAEDGNSPLEALASDLDMQHLVHEFSP